MIGKVSNSLVVVAVVLGMSAASGSLQAQAKGKTKKEAAPTYAVVLIKTSLKDLGKCEVMESKKVQEAATKAKKEYAESLKAWTKEKADFYKDKANRGKKFTKPKPSATTVRALKSGIKTEEAAQKLAEAYQAKLNKKSSKAKGAQS